MEVLPRRHNACIAALIVLSLFGVMAATSVAQTDSAPTASAQDSGDEAEAQSGILQIVFSSVTGFLIVMVLLALSMATVALVIEHILSIRARILMPPGLAEEVQAQLTAGKVSGAEALCRQKPSFLAFVLQAGISELDGGWTAVEKGMEDAAAEQSARLFRKIEYLSVIANIAPMVGLLGTVVGMMFAFEEVADSEGRALARDLAQGIYQALVTTVGGLIVAIPSLGAFAVFRNRVDQLVAEGSYMAQHVFAPLKRRRGQQRRTAATGQQGSSASPPPPPPE
jgi:biopolymer transport protein ExbB